MTLRPWSKFWYQRWGCDLRLRGVNATARGVFWSLYPHLHQGGGVFAFTDDRIPALIDCTPVEVSRALPELIAVGLLERAPDGRVLCPDLRDDLRLSSVRSRSAKGSGESETHCLKKQIRAAKRSSSSSSSSGSLPKTSEGVDLDVLSAPARKAFAEWSAHRLEIKAPLTPGSIKKLVDDAKADPALFIASVEHSIRNGWRGLFPPKDGLHAQANGHAPAPTPKLSDSPVYVDVERTPEERAAYWREFEERKAKIAAEPKYKPRR